MQDLAFRFEADLDDKVNCGSYCGFYFNIQTLLHYQSLHGSALSMTHTITLLHYQSSHGSALPLTHTITLLHYQSSHGSALSLTNTITLLHYQSSHGSALSQGHAAAVYIDPLLGLGKQHHAAGSITLLSQP